jgi:hypothetical protein
VLFDPLVAEAVTLLPPISDVDVLAVLFWGSGAPPSSVKSWNPRMLAHPETTSVPVAIVQSAIPEIRFIRTSRPKKDRCPAPRAQAPSS